MCELQIEKYLIEIEKCEKEFEFECIWKTTKIYLQNATQIHSMDYNFKKTYEYQHYRSSHSTVQR